MSDPEDTNAESDPDPGPESGSDADHAEPGTDGASDSTDRAADLPAEAVDEAERLTRLAREAAASDEREAHRERRAAVVADHGYTTRVREGDTGEVLVLYPTEWTEDGLVRTDRIEDIDRAVERPLSGPGDPEEWAAIEEHNRSIADHVAERHGPVHGANAGAFADFMGNHYARPIESAGSAEIDEFLTEYFPRNAWPSAEQKEVVEDSIELCLEVASEDGRDGAKRPDADHETNTTRDRSTDDASDSNPERF